MLEAKRMGINIENEKIKSENFKVCPHCKTKNPEKALFCVNCGKKLEKNLMIKCPSCNAENAENAKFCVECGEPLNQAKSNKLPGKPIDNTESTADDTKNDIEFVNSINDSEKSEKTKIDVSKNSKTRFPSEVPENDIIGKTGSKKICPSCNGKNLKNAKFCIVCGKNFDETENEDRSSHNLSEDTFSGKPVTTKKKYTPEIKVPNNILELKNEEVQSEKSDKKDVTEEVGDTENRTENIDPVEKIKKAKELLDIGAITTEEFENIKKKYLELI